MNAKKCYMNKESKSTLFPSLRLEKKLKRSEIIPLEGLFSSVA